MTNLKPIRVKTITEGHRMLGLPKPEHPLISVLDYSVCQVPATNTSATGMVLDFYFISLKKGCTNTLQYGQQTYDFDEGMMGFIAPNQVIRGVGPNPTDELSGWILLVHPDLFWGTALAKKIHKYEYFNYSVNEALFLSDKEKKVLNGIIDNIKLEYYNNIDEYSQDIIIAHLEALLNYAERFYQRQFITRKKANSKILERFEDLLAAYFDSDDLVSKGLPTVEYIAESLNISAKYLGSILKQLTGLTTQQHIHEKLIDKAKQKLSVTELSISEIAYGLGFEHPQSFSKLFKTKTNQSPLEFRQSFN